MSRDDTATLVIGHWYSRCSACGGNADPSETAHENVTMNGEGCGAVYTSVAAEYAGRGERESVQAMRPDLPYRRGAA